MTRQALLHLQQFVSYNAASDLTAIFLTAAYRVLCAAGVPFTLAAVSPMEAAAGVEELALPEALVHQVYCCH